MEPPRPPPTEQPLPTDAAGESDGSEMGHEIEEEELYQEEDELSETVLVAFLVIVVVMGAVVV